MKKELKIALSVLLSLVVFLGGVIVGSTNGLVQVNVAEAQQADATQAPTQAPATQASTPAAPVTQPTQAPATQAPSQAPSEAPSQAPSEAPSQAPSEAPSGTSVPSTKEEVAAAYSKVLNDFKHYTGNVTLKRSETIDIQPKDLPAIASAVVNPIVEKFTGTTVRTFTFENNQETTYDEGNGPQPSDGRSISNRIVPGSRDVVVDPAGLVSGTATPGANGGYSMKLVFVAETSKYDGATKTNTSEPTYHKGALDPLDLGSIKELEGILTAADMSYPGATIEADVDGQGRLVKMHYNLPLEGTGTGKVGISITLGVTGSMDATYEITYA